MLLYNQLSYLNKEPLFVPSYTNNVAKGKDEA